MITTGLTMVLSSLYGCISQPVASDDTPIIVVNPSATTQPSDSSTGTKSLVILGNNQSLTTQSSLKGNTLILGRINVNNWPLSQVPCVQCKVTLNRSHHPDGPTTWLSIKGEGNSRVWIASSFQKQFNIDRWQLKHNDHQVIINDSLSKKKTIIAENIQSAISLVPDNHCSVLWANKKLLPQPGAHISADIAQFNSQLIIRCD